MLRAEQLKSLPRFGVMPPQVWKEVGTSFLGGFLRACTVHMEGQDEAGKVIRSCVAVGRSIVGQEAAAGKSVVDGGNVVISVNYRSCFCYLLSGCKSTACRNWDFVRNVDMSRQSCLCHIGPRILG